MMELNDIKRGGTSLINFKDLAPKKNEEKKSVVYTFIRTKSIRTLGFKSLKI